MNIDALTKILYYILFAIIAFSIIGGIAMIVLYKNRKKRKKMEENAIYEHLNRKDTADYLKLDDISDDMIIANNGYRFVGVIKCQGFDFFSAPEVEQNAAAANFLGFIGTIDSPVTYRQHSKMIDLENTVLRYEEKLREKEKLLYNIVEDKKELIAAMKNTPDMTVEQLHIYEDKILEVERMEKSYSFSVFHLKDQLRYIKKYSENGASVPEKVQEWEFEWSYDSNDFLKELSKEEIYEKAKSKLKIKAKNFTTALGNCKVKTRRYNTEELLEVNRLYSSPISSNRYRLRDLVNSNFFDYITKSNDVKEKIQKSKEDSADYMGDRMVELMYKETLLEQEGKENGSL